MFTLPDKNIFFSKQDPQDIRMGDIVGCGQNAISKITKLAIVGCPQDIGVMRNGGRVGAKFAPLEFRKSFYKLTNFDCDENVVLPENFIVDLGDITFAEDDELEVIHEKIYSAVMFALRQNLVPLVVGGGHDITYPCVKAVKDFIYNNTEVANKDLAVINFDAHLDCRPVVNMRNSGTSFRMLIDENIIMAKNVLEFGIQPFVNSFHHFNWLLNKGGNVFTLKEIQKMGIDNSLEAAYNKVCRETDFKLSHNKLYLTLDIDAVNSAQAPGVSATAIDGFSAKDLFQTARFYAAKQELLAVDIAEFNPTFDDQMRTAKLVAQAVLQFAFGLHARYFQPRTI